MADSVTSPTGDRPTPVDLEAAVDRLCVALDTMERVARRALDEADDWVMDADPNSDGLVVTAGGQVRATIPAFDGNDVTADLFADPAATLEVCAVERAALAELARLRARDEVVQRFVADGETETNPHGSLLVAGGRAARRILAARLDGASS